MEKLKDPVMKSTYAATVAQILEESKVDNINNIEGLTEAIGSALQQAADKQIKYERIPKKPWITQDTLEIVEKKRAAKKIRSENPEGMDRYRQLCREVKKATKQDKQRWIEQQCAFIESCHGNKKAERHTRR